jgi:hypothetical protein
VHMGCPLADRPNTAWSGLQSVVTFQEDGVCDDFMLGGCDRFTEQLEGHQKLATRSPSAHLDVLRKKIIRLQGDVSGGFQCLTLTGMRFAPVLSRWQRRWSGY